MEKCQSEDMVDFNFNKLKNKKIKIFVGPKLKKIVAKVIWVTDTGIMVIIKKNKHPKQFKRKGNIFFGFNQIIFQINKKGKNE